MIMVKAMLRKLVLRSTVTLNNLLFSIKEA